MNLKSYKVTHMGFDLTPDLLPVCESIRIIDKMGLEADEIEIVINDDGLLWLDTFKQGDEIEIEITDFAGFSFKSGKFFVDTISGGIGDNTTITVGAVSMPMDRAGLQNYMRVNKKRMKIKKLMTDLCKVAELDIVYRFVRDDGREWNFEILNVSHMSERVGAVILQYAEKYGMLLKLHNNQLIVSNKKAFANDPELAVIDPKLDSIEGFEYELNFATEKTYVVRYYNPKKGKYVKDNKNGKSQLLTDNDTLREHMESMASPEDARAFAMAVDSQDTFSVNFAMQGNPDIVAGGVIGIEGLKRFSGKYLVTEVEQEIGETWKTKISATALF